MSRNLDSGRLHPGSQQTATLVGRAKWNQGQERSPRFPARANWTPPQQANTAADEQNGLRKLALWAGLAMLFVRITVLPEILASVLHVNTYLLYVVGPPAMFGALFTGAIGRTMRHRAAKYWVGFSVCILIALPFSSWRGGSAELVRSYMLFSLPLLFTVGGLAVTWRDVRSTFSTIALAGVVFCFSTRFLADEESGRVAMNNASGTIGNSNDLASQIILVLPFLLYIFMDRRRFVILRYVSLLTIPYGLWVTLGTASRGALLALFASFLFVLFRASAAQRVAALALMTVIVLSLPVILQSSAATRLGSMFGGQDQEAKESEDSRRYLLQQSIRFTFEHPVLGVGPGQFSIFEGTTAKANGQIGNWHETHNAFTQVSSECGVPALIFFLAAIGSIFGSVSKIYRQARRQGHKEIVDASFCYLLSMVGFLVSIVFLANAYRFYLPVLIGLGIALTAAAKKELEKQQDPAARETGLPALHPVRY
jgi:O-antigen ligase